MPQSGSPARRFVSDKAVAERYGVSRDCVWRWVRAGRLPSPYRLAEKTTRWAEDELDARDAELMTQQRRDRGAA